MLELSAEVFVFVVLLAGALIVAALATRLRIPYTVALVLIGLPLSTKMAHLGAGVPPFAPILLFVFLPALLFEAAWNLRVDALRRMWRPIAVLAVPGVLITAAIIAGADYYGHTLAAPGAFLLGAILAATDPVAVIETFRRLPVPPDLQALVEGESLANDGVAIVLYSIGLGVATTGQLHLGAALQQFLWATGGGVGVGLAVAIAIAALLRGLRSEEARVVGTVVLAYGAFVIADRIGASGVFATIAAGIALRAFVEHDPLQDVAVIDTFWGVLAFLANSLVFLELGINIEFRRMLHEPQLVAITLGAVIVARVALAYGLLPPSLPRTVRHPKRWYGVVAYAGLRGALGLALALALPNGIPNRPQIIDAVFAVVVVTLVVQGWTVEPLIKRLAPS